MLTLIFGVWINLSMVANLQDSNYHISNMSWGCVVIMRDDSYVFVPHKKCYDVGMEMKKNGL